MLWHRDYQRKFFINSRKHLLNLSKPRRKLAKKNSLRNTFPYAAKPYVRQKWINWMEDDAMWAESTRGCLQLSRHFLAQRYRASLRNIQFYRRDSCLQCGSGTWFPACDSIMMRVMASYHTLYVQEATTINKSSSQCAVKWVTGMEAAQRTNNCGTGSFHVHQLFASHSQLDAWCRLGAKLKRHTPCFYHDQRPLSDG